MRSLLPAPQLTLRRAATDTQMEMIIMWLAPGWFMENPRRSEHRMSRGFVQGGVSEESCFERVGAEEPLDPRVLVQDQCAHQIPVSGFVEVIDPIRRNTEAQVIELQQARNGGSQTSGVPGEEEKVRIPASPMASMPDVSSTGRIGKVSHAKRIATRKRTRDLMGGSFDRLDEGLGPVSGRLPRTQPAIAVAPVVQRQGISKIPVIGRPDRDRLSRRSGLGHACTEGRDSE